MAVRDLSVSACLSHPRIKLLSQTVHHCYMSRLMTKPTKLHVRPANTQISLGISPVWSEYSLSTWRKLGSLASSYPLNAQRSLWSDWADAQTDLSLGWAHSHFVGFVIRRLIYQTPQQRWLPVSVTSRITTGTEGMQLLGSLLKYRCSGTLLQHMFLDCNCIYRQFIESKKKTLCSDC